MDTYSLQNSPESLDGRWEGCKRLDEAVGVSVICDWAPVEEAVVAARLATTFARTAAERTDVPAFVFDGIAGAESTADFVFGTAFACEAMVAEGV